MSIEATNTHDQLTHASDLGLIPVAIIESWGGQRERYLEGYAIYHLREKTNPNAAWYNYGRKVFLCFGKEGKHHQRMAAALADAKTWTAEKYGVTEWEKNQMRDYVPAPLNSKVPLRKT